MIRITIRNEQKSCHTQQIDLLKTGQCHVTTDRLGTLIYKHVYRMLGQDLNHNKEHGEKLSHNKSQ